MLDYIVLLMLSSSQPASKSEAWKGGNAQIGQNIAALL
jgi:hypothetical protein